MAVLALPLCSCGDDFDSYSMKFYDSIDKSGFYYKATVTENGETYTYSQAVKDNIVTTIEDRENDKYDGYVIFDGSIEYKIIFNERCYDAEITSYGVGFLFDVEDADNYNYPESIEDETFEGKTYRCETFRVVDSNGKTTGENKYYFNGERLYAITWIENGSVTRTMKFEEYSDSIPEDIYFAPPEDFKARTLEMTQEVPFESVFPDYFESVQ